MKKINEIHFFDLDHTLWETPYHIWVIDKKEPYKYILKLTPLEFSNIENGFYKHFNFEIKYNGKSFFISKDLYEKIQKIKKINIIDLGISFRELHEEEFINNNPMYINWQYINHLINRKDIHIALLTGRYKQEKYEKLLNKLRIILKERGLEIFKIYFVGELKNSDSVIANNKAKIILEHLTGLKIEDQRFVEKLQDDYTDIHFYDDLWLNFNKMNNLNNLFYKTLENTKTNKVLYDRIVDRLKENDLNLINYLVSSNELNWFETYELKLQLPNLYENKIYSFNNFLDNK